ncbi:hypothetical protein PQ455_13140 [Sphingomonas naphthae]|uniref:Tyr recombinase domain-containing protein n=1 Tax=Sphingomonas naphthae TaxID=1813468 RepID=A0ABY7THE6_9SPHN|nr:hypothetical protein [Sphingomonas naphthae]WCT72575.1 hypothetical protein PQ455_13140 [Sphingomonas naphthae]
MIQLKAALNHAKNAKRIAQKVEVGHLTRNQVTPARNDRLSLSALGELLDYTVRGGSGKYSTPERLIGLRRYLIAAVATLGRPDSILDISVRPNRSQWLAEDRRLDLNPAGRVQTKKYRAVLPVGDVFAEWLNSTTDWFVCAHRRETDPATGESSLRQIGLDSVRSAWDTARDHLKLPAGWGTRLLRHSVATILANRGINPVELKIAMGHEPIVGTTARYVIFDPSYLVSFQRLVDELFDELSRMAPAALIFPSAR